MVVMRKRERERRRKELVFNYFEKIKYI